MKSKLMAVSVCLAAVLAMGGCSNTGSNDGSTTSPGTSPSTLPSNSPSATPSTTPSATPSTTPSARPSDGVNDYDIPNNAGGTANNGGSGTDNVLDDGTADDGATAGRSGRSGMGRNHNGTYSAGDDGAVNGAGTGSGLIHDAGNAVRDAADGVERAVRDIM